MLGRKIRFSDGIKSRFTPAERDKLAADFADAYKRTGRGWFEKHVGVGGDVVICDVTPKLFRLVLEEEW